MLTNKKLFLEGKEISTDEQLIATYQTRIASYGMSGKAMFYIDEAQHQVKVAQFAIILHELISPNDKVLDVGCGYGSLVPLLPPCQYTGIDLVPEFISYAKDRYKLVEFKTLSIDECKGSYDWCVLLGVVNGISSPEHIVESAWEKCTKGVIVDFIDKNKLPDSQKDLNRFDMGSCLTKMLKMGASSVDIHTTENVWTIFVARKDGRFIKSRYL